MGVLDAVRSAFGLLNTKPKKGAGTLVTSQTDDLPIWRQFTRIGGAVTPDQLTGYLREADSGRIGHLIGYSKEARQKDGHLHGILQTRELAFQSLEWEWYIPGADPESSRGKRQVRFLEEQTRGNPEFDSLLAKISGDFYPSFSVSECIYRKDGRNLVLDRTKQIDDRRMGFRVSDGELIFRDDPNLQLEIDFSDFEPGKFIVTKRRISNDVPAREGLNRVLLWAALFRNWTLSDWLRLGEIAWKPWRIGKYKKSEFASKEDVNDLYKLLQGLTASGVALIPDSVEVDVGWATGNGGQSSAGGGNHERLHGAVGREMSKAVLGQDATTEQSSTSGFAQAKVQERVQDYVLAADARSASGFVTEQFAKPLIAMNFGPQADVPHFRLKIAKPTDIGKVSLAIATLANVGLAIPAKWARQQIGAPTPEKDEELVGDYVKPAPDNAEPKEPEGDGETEPGEGKDEEQGKATKE